MAKKYPDITDWKNLNKYADLFKTSESGGKGQLLDGDPSYVTNDDALVKNLKLNFKVVYARQRGGADPGVPAGRAEQEAAARLLLRAAVVPVRGASWSRSTCRRTRRAATPTRRRSPATTRRTTSNKIVSTKFADSGSPALHAGQELQVDQRRPEPGRQVHRRGQDDADDDAAKKWVDANPDKVKAWLA